MDTPYAFVARLEAKPEQAEALAALLAGALPLAQAEAGTVDWFCAWRASSLPNVCRSPS